MDPVRVLLFQPRNLTYWENAAPVSLFEAMFDELLNTHGFRTTDTNAEERIKKAFNDAAYICTLTVDFYIRPYLHIGDYRSIVRRCSNESDDYADIVLCLAWCMLTHITDWESDKKIRSAVSEIDKCLRRSRFSSEVYESFFNATRQVTETLPKEFFARRTLTPEILSKHTWSVLTNKFDLKAIREIVRVYSRSDEEKLMFIDEIEKQATKEWEADNPADDLPF